MEKPAKVARAKRDIVKEIDDFGREVGADLLVVALKNHAPHVSAANIHAELVQMLDERLNISSVSPRARKAAMSIIDRLLVD